MSLGEFEEDTDSARVAAWALVDGGDGAAEVVGLVVSDGEPARIVPAVDGASAVAPDFDRYGFAPASWVRGRGDGSPATSLCSQSADPYLPPPRAC